MKKFKKIIKKQKKKEKFEKLNYSEDLEYWFRNIPGITHEWNFYLDFKNKVIRKEKHDLLFKSAKDFIKKYKTVIKKDLKEKN
ncbi:hypothetical protein HYE11_01905 [Mycoplasmopsis bovis]|nr:hypothetical protein HYE11_01905 [Mycoplasmopsis bovis]